MVVDPSNPILSAFAARWWVLVLRGVAAISFGLLALAMPELTLLTLVVLFGAYALVEGVLCLLLAPRAKRAGASWGWFVFAGFVGIGAGLVTFTYPGITAMSLLTVIAVWAVLSGIAQLVAAFALRREITGEWLLGASGAVSIAFGALLLMFPGAGALALVWMIGGYALFLGALLIGWGVQLERFVPPTKPVAPSAGVPTPA